ncbi:MAG: hypothetical protein AAGE52_13220 [Myxococcota bacterium]
MRNRLLVLLILACNPSNETDVVVELQTDLVPGIEFVRIETQVGESSTAASVFRSDRFQTFRRVAEVSAPRGVPTEVEVRLLDEANREVARRTVSALPSGSVYGVQVVVSRDCWNVTCGTETSCLQGRCVLRECATGEEASCPAPACAAGSDCAGAHECASAECSHGVCLYFPVTDACPPGGYCDPDRGCQGSGEVDAMVDAGQDSAPPCTDGDACDPGIPCVTGVRNCAANTCETVDVEIFTDCEFGSCVAGECIDRSDPILAFAPDDMEVPPTNRLGAAVALAAPWILAGEPTYGNTVEAQVGRARVAHNFDSFGSLGVFGLSRRCGHSVLLEGNVAVFGCPSVNPDNVGSIDTSFLEPASGDAPLQGVQRRATFLDLADPVFGDRFGTALAVDGSRLYVGAPGYRSGDSTADSGLVAVYEFPPPADGAPLEQVRWIPPARGIIAGDEFGSAIALNDHHLLVGAAQQGLGGYIEVFPRVSATRSVERILPGPGVTIGGILAADGDRVVVGLPLNHAARVYVWNGSSYEIEAMLTTSSFNLLGDAVAIRDRTILVGAPRSNRVMEFARGDAGWFLNRIIDPVGLQAGDEFGAAVAFDDELIVVGAPGTSSSDTPDQGRIWVFER